METNNLLVVVAVVAVFFSLVGTIVTYNSVSTFKNFISGFAVEEGIVNVTISEITSIEIYSAGGTLSSKTLDWGAGTVDGSFALLVSNGTVVGNSTGWGTPVDEGFLVRNIGNVNVTLGIHSSLVAADFIGGTSPLFQYNITNYEDGSCGTFEGDSPGTYISFTDSTVPACTSFDFSDASDELRIDILLKIPSDSYTGVRNNTVVLTYAAVV